MSETIRYVVPLDGGEKAAPPWELISAIAKGDGATIEIEPGVELPRARNFLDGLAMFLAQESGSELRNRFLRAEAEVAHCKNCNTELKLPARLHDERWVCEDCWLDRDLEM